jgi:hypothetical protein
MRPELVRIFPLVVLLLTGAVLVAAEQPLALEPVEEISQETKTEIKFALKLKPADAEQPRFAVAKVRKGGMAIGTPKGLQLDEKTGALSWTPTPSQAGNYELTLSAKDAKDNETTTTVKITVRERAITTDGGEVGKLLKKWYAEGTAAGNTGDFYDNRDRDHSPLNRSVYPQLDELMYTPEERKVDRDWAAQFVLLPQVTFGNSSTSAPVTGGGSNVRFYYTHPRGLTFLYQEYRGNNIYMYPAHHDHHPGHNGKPFYGDVYPVNSPYLLTSQGSSGSDQPFMRAVPFTLAAFHPEVKKKLIETNLLMPTVQMILRYTNKHLTDPKEYLTGKAHPAVFEGSWVNDLKMIQMAHEMKVDNIPPMIQLKVVEEDKPENGRDYFEPAGLTELLGDTPAAIGRVVRGGNYVRRMIVSAEDSFDVNKHRLTYHWAVLRGDAERIQIKPKNEAGSVVEILVPYHDRQPVAGHHLKIESNRVDIGAFVHNGTYNSTPGFICFHTLDTEARTYDDKGRLLEIGYGAGDADIAVSDWNALFALLRSEEKSFAAGLLQESFTSEERAAIAKIADDYKAATAELSAAQEKSKQTGEVRQRIIAELKAADEKKNAAQKANEKEPSDLTLMAYKQAAVERDAVEDRRKAAETDYQAAQKTVEAARKKAEGILGQKPAGSEKSTKELVETALNKLKENASFAGDHRKEIEALQQGATDAAKGRVTAARKRLVQLGILEEKGGQYELRPIQSGDKPPAERLTRFEKTVLERFHAEILSAVVYPKFLTANFKVNFVDFRLTTHKSWRDVYHHTAKGDITGWTRYEGDKPVEFNAAGQIVLEKDGKGRATKTRTVKYQLDESVKPPAVRSLKQLPGDHIVYYEYEGNDDFKGKVVKQEAADEKK